MFTCWQRLNFEGGGGYLLGGGGLISMWRRLFPSIYGGGGWCFLVECVETLSSGGGLTSRLRRVFTWWRLEYINVDVNMDHLTFN